MRFLLLCVGSALAVSALLPTPISLVRLVQDPIDFVGFVVGVWMLVIALLQD